MADNRDADEQITVILKRITSNKCEQNEGQQQVNINLHRSICNPTLIAESISKTGIADSTILRDDVDFTRTIFKEQNLSTCNEYSRMVTLETYCELSLDVVPPKQSMVHSSKSLYQSKKIEDLELLKKLLQTSADSIGFRRDIRMNCYNVDHD